MKTFKKENIYIDLSKLSEEEIKSLPNIIIESGEFIYEMTENMLNTGGLIDEDGDSSYILLAKSNKNEWIAYLESGCKDKTEITLSEFRQLFSKGEEVLQVENYISIEELTKLCNEYNRSNLKISNLKRDLEYKNNWDEQSFAIQQIKQEISILQKIKENAKSKLQYIGIEF